MTSCVALHRTMACPLPDLAGSSFEGSAQARSGLFNTEGPASIARKLQNHPLRATITAALPSTARSGSAWSEGSSQRKGSAGAEASQEGVGAGANSAKVDANEAPVQTRFSIVQAVPSAESALAADEI